MNTPAIYRTRIRHVRAGPIRHAFDYPGYSWFVDLDELPGLPVWLRPFARFDARDHFDRSSARGTLRAGLDAVLVDAGIDPRGLRVTALLGARVLGRRAPAGRGSRSRRDRPSPHGRGRARPR